MSELAYKIYKKNLKDITKKEAIYLVQYAEFITNKLWLTLLVAKTK